jgi:hypothetical protein
MRWLLAAITMTVLAGFGMPAHGEDSPPHPIQAGERLTYELSWLNILAGTAVMEVAESRGNGDSPALKLLMTAQSSPKVTRFYPVDNRVESLVDPRSFQSERMTFRRREGKRKNDFEYTFHHQEGTVTAVKDGVSETLSIPPGTLDAIPVCTMYAASCRSSRAHPNRSMFTMTRKTTSWRYESRVWRPSMDHGGKWKPPAYW